MEFFWFVYYWRSLMIISVPIVLMPLPLILQSQAGYCGYILLVMATFWIFECVPIPVTGIIPIFMMPLLGMQDTEVVVQDYMKDSSMVFIGGMLIALAFEFSNIHKRIALKVMLFMGVSVSRLLLGIMLTTMGLSMWMFNVAAAAMMTPIVVAVVQEMHKNVNEVNPGADKREVEEGIDNVRTMFLLGVCYSSNLGGTGVITGTSTNMIGVEILSSLDPKHHGDFASLTFSSWMFFATVPMILNVFMGWIYLQLFFTLTLEKLKFWKKSKDCSNNLFSGKSEKRMRNLLEGKYKELGPLTTHEKALTFLFLLALFMWIFHDPKIIPGWSALFQKKVGISTGTLVICILLFVIPRDKEFYSAFKTGDFSDWEFRPLLDWEFAQQRIPWGLTLLMLGGGYALANVAKKTGLSAWMGKCLGSMSEFPPSAIQVICLLFIAYITEFASNSATASIIVPILLELSTNLGIHPLYLTFPATIASSFAFMLPVATATNAVIYSAQGANLKLSTMAKAGFFMNLFSVLVLCFCANFYGELIFKFSQYKYIQ